MLDIGNCPLVEFLDVDVDNLISFITRMVMIFWRIVYPQCTRRHYPAENAKCACVFISQ